MLRSAFPLLAGLSLLSALTYGAGLVLFRAQAQDEGVELAWDASDEQGVSSYEVYRQDEDAGDFDQITSLSPTAQPQYHYFDENAYHHAPFTKGKGPVAYRLMVRTATGTRSYHATAAPETENPMASSWNLIKVMFR